MHAYVKTAVLMFALGLAHAAPAAGKGGSSSSAASSGAAGAGHFASGSSSAPAGGGSTNRGGGMSAIYQTAPELDPKRKISEQDCTKPIVHDAGNLRCK